MVLRRHGTLVFGLSLVLACNGDDGSSDSTSETGDADTTGDGDSTGDPDTTGDGDTTSDADTTDADTTGVDTTADTTDTGNLVEFPAIYEMMITQGCTAGYCHGAGQGGLDMVDAPTAYMNLVDVDATMAVCGLTKRVVPGDPESSIMWRKVRPLAMDMGMPCAEKMPMGSEGLPPAEAQLVYDWITNGALP